MSYNYNFNFFNSDEESNSSFNQSNLNFNNVFPTSNFPFNFTTDNENPSDSEKQYSAINKNNDESSLINKNNNNSNSIHKEKLEIAKRDKKQDQIVNIDNKSSESKQEDKFNKVNKKVIFNIDDSLSTANQTQNKKLKKNKTSVKSRRKKNNKNIPENSFHNKFSDDNTRRKCKFILLAYIKDFINKKIEEKYNNIGCGVNIKKLMTLNKKQVSNSKIDFNKEFLKKTLSEIFSEPISSRYTNYPNNKNEKLIEELFNEKDNEKRLYFQKLFNLSFLDCVNHFIENEKIEILEGLTLFKEMIVNEKELKNKNIVLDGENSDEYLKHLEYYFKDYEEILRRKSSRKRKN